MNENQIGPDNQTDTVLDFVKMLEKWIGESYSDEMGKAVMDRLREVNLYAKRPDCDPELRDRIYNIKHRWLGRFFRHGHITAVRTVRNEISIPCPTCRGHRTIYVPTLGAEVECSACEGSGKALRAVDLYTSPKYLKSAYYACRVEIDGKYAIWHIRVDKARGLGIFENNPDAINPHRLVKRGT